MEDIEDDEFYEQFEKDQNVLDKIDEEEDKKQQKGIRKWSWLIWGLLCITLGISLIFSYFYWNTIVEVLFYGCVALIIGIISLIYREVGMIIL